MNDQQPPRPPHDDRTSHPQNTPLPSERQRLQTVQHRWDTVHQDLVTTRIVRGIYYLGGALELLLALRFLLQFSGANRDNLFARFIYNLSGPFAAPFDGLFSPPTFGGGANIFDTNLLVAMVSYSILVLLAIRLIWVFRVERR